MKPKSALRSFLALAGSSILAISTAQALTYYWDGTSDTWSTVGRWSTDAAGTTDALALPLVSDDLFFNITGLNTAQNITLDGNQAAKSLTFNTTGSTNILGNSSGTTARTLTLGGNITLAAGAGPVIIGESPATYGAVNLFLDASQTWTNSSTSVLSVKSDVNLNGKTLTLTGGPHNISGNITGSGTLTLNASPTRRVLSGANEFTNAITVNGSSAVGVLAFTSIENFGSTTANALGKVASGSISLGTGTNSAGRLEYIGSGNSSSDRTITFAGSSSNSSGQIFNNGTGTLTLTAATLNTANGTAARYFVLGGSNTGSNEIRGIIANNDTGTMNLTKTGSGTWVLGGANTYTGSTTLNGGTLKLNYGTNGTDSSKLSDTAVLNLNGGTLDLAGSAGAHNEVVSYAVTGGGTTFVTRSSGSAILDLGQINSLTQSMTTNATTTVTVADTSVLRVGMPITGTGIPASTTIASIVDGNTITISAAATNSATNTATLGTASLTAGAINFQTGSIAKTTTLNHASGALASAAGNYRLTVAGANWAINDGSGNIVAYTGYTTGYAGGAMLADTNYSIEDGTSITVDRGAATNTLKIATTAASSIAISDAATFTLGSMLFAGAHNYEISTTGSGKIAVNRLHNYGAGTLTLGTLGSMGVTGLSLYGTGKTILNGGTAGNDYNLTIAGGTLQFSNKLQLGPNTTGRVITLNNGALLADSTGGNIAIENGPGVASRTITLGAGGGTLDIIGGNKLTVPGVISGADGQLIIGGAGSNGTVELTAANTYTGATTIKGGTLEVSAGNINTTTSVTINGGVLKYGSTTGLTKDVTVAGGTFRYNSSVAYSGALTFTSGSVGGTNLTGSLDNLTVGANQTLSPGNSPGTATTGSQTWAGGGSYAWEINDANATAGADPGWDLLSGTGTLTITATSGSKFNLNLFALLTTPADTQGLLTDFNNATSYDWLIADFANAVSGFSADAFNINTTNFVNNNPINGSFAIALGDTVSGGNNTQIYLTYTAIPEPNTAALLGSLGMLMLLRRRRN